MKPNDLITMRELSETVGKTRAAVYQWKKAYSFPFRVYKNSKGNESVSQKAVDKWLKSEGTTVKRKSGRKTVRKSARTSAAASAPKLPTGTVPLPLTDDFPISFWSEVVDAMTERGTGLVITYEAGDIIMRHS